jgi:hypothetical protein
MNAVMHLIHKCHLQLHTQSFIHNAVNTIDKYQIYKLIKTNGQTTIYKTYT